MNGICFRATKIDNVVIKERQKNRHYKDKEVSLLKVSGTKSDMNALHDLSILWDYDFNYVSSIVSNYTYYENEDKTIYLISSQEKNFKKLDPKKILGIAELTKGRRSYKVNYIQTRPDCTNPKKSRPFKMVGDVLMGSIVNLTGNLRIYLDAVREAVKFYERFGFKIAQDDAQAPLMVLIKKKKLR